MRVIISGPVTAAHLQDAEFMAGITPTSYVTNGKSTPPKSPLPTSVMPICPMLPEAGERQRNYSLVHNADALVCAGGNQHLVDLAKRYELLVWEV